MVGPVAIERVAEYGNHGGADSVDVAARVVEWLLAVGNGFCACRSSFGGDIATEISKARTGIAVKFNPNELG